MVDLDSEKASKQPCYSGEEEEIDRISDLPDELLCHILSNLPTLACVSTTILSKRWEDLWTQVPAFNFYDFCQYTRKKGFLRKFVNNVCIKSKTENIRNFTLQMAYPSQIDEQVLTESIGSAVRRHVQEFSLDIWYSKKEAPKLPLCVFDCKTLVSLVLKYEIFVDVPATFNLPCLRILQLKRVKYANNNILNRLVSGCSILEDLTIERRYHDHNIVVLDINAPSLTRMPSLKRIDLKDDLFSDLNFDAPHLAKASIALTSTIWRAKFSVFHNLVHLDMLCSCQDWHALLPLLDCSNNLKILEYRSTFSHVVEASCDKDLAENVPKCVSTSLKTLILTRVHDLECELKLLKYVLKNAKVLEQMKIIDKGSLRERRWLMNPDEELLNFPRASMACHISFVFP